MAFLDYLINGISLGSIYAVIALGYTLVYGIAKMLNFAHGDVIMVGGYVIFTMMSNVGLNSYVSVLIAMAACTVLGITIEKIAYKPLRQSTNLAVLITAIGVSYFLQNIALIIFGEKPVTFKSVIDLPKITLFDGQIVIKSEAIASIIVSVVIVVGLSLFVNKTKSGRAMLAVSEDKDAARLMGINVNRTISLTFAIGSGLAAIAGALLCSSYPVLSNTTGAMPGIKAFVAAVFGGIGSIPGAMVGGLLIGVIEILGRAYISPQLADAIVFAVLIIVLIVRPTGILGKKVNEKV
ncbi:MAG: branched-chain amino acid ABC transporter permease [Ruminococcus sp.]|nr:branched-chain amino acid ABC transporter permease [Ruminococcus sp.]